MLLVIGYTVGILDRLAGYLHAAFDITAGLREGRRSELSPNCTLSNLEWNQSRFVAKLRDNLTLDSVVLRHALRLGVTAAVGVIIYSIFGLKEGYWVTLTVVVILKPYSGDTFQRGVQRVVGTVFGGILAAVLASLIRTPLIMVCVLFPLTVITISLQPLNYGFYAFFLTSQVVLMDNILEPWNWHLAIDRIQDTVIGGVIALIGGYVLWPSRKHRRISDRFAASIEANCIYFQDVLAKYLGREIFSDQGHTPIREAVLDYTLVGIEVKRITRIVTILHSAVSRMGDVEP